MAISYALFGMDHRLKSQEAIVRKLDMMGDIFERGVKDVLRYSVIFDYAGLAEATQGFIAGNLEPKGYTTLRLKDTFRRGELSPGINAVLLAPKDTVFEIQFHTPESYDFRHRLAPEIYARLKKPMRPESPGMIQVNDDPPRYNVLHPTAAILRDIAHRELVTLSTQVLTLAGVPEEPPAPAGERGMYRYFQAQNITEPVFLFRWPDNGLSFVEQDRDEVECMVRGSTADGWTRSRWEFLLDEFRAGWWSELQDRITEQQATAIIAEWKEQDEDNPLWVEADQPEGVPHH